MKTFGIIAILLVGCAAFSCDTGEEGEDESLKPFDKSRHSIDVLWPHQTRSAWGADEKVIVLISQGEPGIIALDDVWRKAIGGVVEISDFESGATVPFDIIPQEPLSTDNAFALQPATPFAADRTYRVKVNPPPADAALENLHVSGMYSEVAGAPECRFIHTLSRPMVSTVLFNSKGDDSFAVLSMTMSEVIRQETLDDSPKPQLLIDGVDRTACQGPPSCCIMEMSADGGGPATGCTTGGGGWSYGGEIISGDVDFFFKVPSETYTSFSTLQIRLPAAWKGVEATVADAITGMPDAKLDGDWVVYTFSRQMFGGGYGGTDGGLSWFSPCE